MLQKRETVRNIFLLMIVVGGGAAWLFLSSLSTDTLFPPYLPPGGAHWLGTDSIGRDILSELFRAGRLSLIVGLVAALAATLMGTVAGCVAGYFRSLPDLLIMRCADLFLLIPGIPLVIVMVSFLEPGISNIILVIAFTSWPGTARVIRSRVLQIRQSPFILNSRSMGAGDFHIILRHILPNTRELILAKATLAVAGAMLTEAGISFLGLGDPRNKTWGSMLHDAFTGAALINGYWWWYLPPVFCISLAVGGFNLTGHLLFKDETPGSGYAVRIKPEKIFKSDRKFVAPWHVFQRFKDRGCFTKRRVKPLEKSTPSSGSGQAVSSHHFTEKNGEKDGAPIFIFKDLQVNFRNKAGKTATVLNDIDLTIKTGDKTAVIGETGSGKSILLLAMTGLLPGNADVSGEILYCGENVRKFSPGRFRRLRAVEAIYIPQGAGNALNPVIKLWKQVTERNRRYSGMKRKEARAYAAALFNAMGISKPLSAVDKYPHQFSGGMKQRVLLAMAMAAEKGVLLADEPTKGLDWETRDDILKIFKKFGHEAILTVTHDLWFARRFARNIVVMHGGVVLETAPVDSFFRRPYHPYSRALLDARPSRGLNVESFENKADGRINGCSFISMCRYAHDACRTPVPMFMYNGHQVRCCHYAS